MIITYNPLSTTSPKTRVKLMYGDAHIESAPLSACNKRSLKGNISHNETEKNGEIGANKWKAGKAEFTVKIEISGPPAIDDDL